MMMPFPSMGKFLIVIGLVMVAVGVLIVVVGRLPRLPGDIVVERPHLTIYFPLGTMIVVSVLLTILLALLGRR